MFGGGGERFYFMTTFTKRIENLLHVCLCVCVEHISAHHALNPPKICFFVSLKGLKPEKGYFLNGYKKKG